MKPYHNLFYMFKQGENQATKAILNTLEYIDSTHTKAFIERFTGKNNTSNKFQFTHQGILSERNLEESNAANYLFGIAETTNINLQKSNKLKGFPDGGIFTLGLKNQINIAIETKIGEVELNRDQLDRHQKLFGSNKAKEIQITWDEIRDFFRSIQSKNEVEAFLLQQFEQFCLVCGHGTVEKDREYWLSQFHAYYDIAIEIDNLLLGHGIGYDVYVQKTRNYGIGYNNRDKSVDKRFAKLHVQSDQYILMLTFGTVKQNYANIVRDKYNIVPVFNKNQNVSKEQKTHEVWIPLDWIQAGDVSLGLVKDLCKLAYEVCYMKGNIKL